VGLPVSLSIEGDTLSHRQDGFVESYTRGTTGRQSSPPPGVR